MASSSNPVKPSEQQTQETSKDARIRNPKSAKICTFSFELHPASKLKQALKALTDEEFNKEGIATIEVLHTGVGIMVRNFEDDVLGILVLRPTGLVKFDVVKPLKRKMINLKVVSQLLEVIDDDRAITLHHNDGSRKLKFRIEEESHFLNTAVNLHEIEPPFEEFPLISYACTCVILNGFLSMLLAQVEATTNKLVLAEVAESRAIFFVGRDQLRYEYDPKKGMCTGLEKTPRHRFWFTLPHCKALKKAMPLAEGALLGLTNETYKRTVFLFDLAELGDLMFVKEPTSLSAIQATVQMDQTRAGLKDKG